MSLLHDVLKPSTNQHTATDAAADKTKDIPPRKASPIEDTSSDDELIGVVSVPGTPNRTSSRPLSGSSSPTRVGTGTGASSRRAPGPLHISSSAASAPSKRSTRDPLRALTTDLNQRIFSQLDLKDLASTSAVSVKWNKSQTLNYLWFQHHRKAEFGDDHLPTGKWTRRESKENWRQVHLQSRRAASELDAGASRYGYSTPPVGGASRSVAGYTTPQQVREERWAEENNAAPATAGKVEMREMYKELGGRKATTKNKFGGGRDKGGWEENFD